MLVQEKIAIPLQIKLGVSENPPFYQCARASARANDARNYAQSGWAMQNQGSTQSRPQRSSLDREREELSETLNKVSSYWLS